MLLLPYILLARYCKNGKLERISRGVYRKLQKEHIVSVTKKCDYTQEE